MKKRNILLTIMASIFLASCSFNTLGPGNDFGDRNNNPEDENLEDPNNPYIDDNPKEDDVNYDDLEDDTDPSQVEDIDVIDQGKFSLKTDDGTFTQEGEVYTITSSGSYDLKGTIDDGYIFVNAGEEDEIELNLKGVSISSTTQSPIYILNAGSVDISAKNGTENIIIDDREAKVEDVDGQGNGAIYAKCDLDIKGKGKLSVKANYNNGIHSTKDLSAKNAEIVVYSYNNAFKGNDSVEIESGNLLLVSSGGNGITTEDTDISSKGKQRGNITISGGTINIYSCKDGIDAAFNTIIQNSTDDDGNVVVPIINVFTSNYSSYSGEVATSQDGTKYLRCSTNISSSERLSIYYQDNNGEDVWSNCSFDSSYQGGGGRPGSQPETYYYYKFSLPSSVEKLQIFKFESSKNNSTSEYVACSQWINVNSNYDTMVMKISKSTITVSSWTSYTTRTNTQPGQPGGGGFNPSEGNTNKSDYSAKGIKADNIVNILGGKIYVKAYDDGIHANYGDTFDNETGEVGLGDVVIEGGDIEIYAADDAIHADRYLTIKSGTINVVSSYEGLEANVISISGGDTTVYATDDGANASNKAGITPQIEVFGGKLDVTVKSGDTDGIDSNGYYKQSGGLVISRGSGSNMSTGLDVDKTATVSGGTFLCFGKPEVTVSTSGSVKNQTISGTFSTGTYQFSCGDYSFTTKNWYMSYKGAYIYSEKGNNFTYTKLA